MKIKDWPTIGTTVGEASTAEFSFILRSFKSRVGDIVAIPMEVPDDRYSGQEEVTAWARIVAIDRFNPFFPYEAAAELESIDALKTVLSCSRDQLQANTVVLGFTSGQNGRVIDLAPLTYPIPPAARVCHPPAEAVRELLAGALQDQTPLEIGTLIARPEVPVSISAEKVVARHLAVMAMTGGGKTVAVRHIIRELAALRYPLLIFDPHGDYLSLWQKRKLFRGRSIKLFFPNLAISEQSSQLVYSLIQKMTQGLTEPQQEALNRLITTVTPAAADIPQYIQGLLDTAERMLKNSSSGLKPVPAKVVVRKLSMVKEQIERMQTSNQRLRSVLRGFKFQPLPDAAEAPQQIISPGQISVLYLGGYDHLTQSTIVSLVMDELFDHRAELSNRIPPFMSIIEEAHNFVPSLREGTEETPSLLTLRRAITEGRKFGVGLLLVTQRPSRVDETILAQCNSFIAMRLVNPRDQNYIRTVMENLPEADARLLPAFGPGQGIISGQAVRFPLLVKIAYDKDLESGVAGDEKFIAQANKWRSGRRVAPSRPRRPRRRGSRR